MKIVIAIIAAIAAAAGAAFGGALWLGERKLDRRMAVRVVPVAYAQPTPQLLARGRSLYEARRCAECHAPDGSGRVVIEEPGGLYVRAPDITPSRAGMVATYGEADWVRAIRHGVDPAGRALLFMPSEDYNRMTDEDFAALVGYLRSLPPGPGTAGEVRLPRMMKARYGVGIFRDAPELIDHRLPPPTSRKAGER